MKYLELFLFYFIIFFIYSFLGWLVEVIYVYYDEDKLINRGFLIGPYCPIYGISSLIMIFALRKYVNSWEVLFVMSFIVCTFVEYITSVLMEKIFNTRWWDYSKEKFNLNGRICLKNSIFFGVLGTLLVYFIHPFIINQIIKINSKYILILSLFLFILFVFDLCVSFNIVSKLKFSQSELKFDNTDHITKRVRETLINKSILMGRLIKAFPELQISNINKIKKRVSNKLRNKNRK